MAERREPRSPLQPLTDGQVQALRTEVEQGRSPRVVVRSSSAGLAAGARGPVVRLGDPAVEEEFIVVRVKGDDIPFAPAELAMPGRAGRAPAASTAPADTSPPQAQAPRPPRKKASTPPRKPAPAAEEPPPAAEAPPSEPVTPARRAVKRATARSTTRAKPPTAVTLTLRFGDGAWTAEAMRGSRRVGGKSVPVRPGAVAALADLIDDEQVSSLIGETVEACRSEVEERAASLRAELAAAEAALKEYER